MTGFLSKIKSPVNVVACKKEAPAFPADILKQFSNCTIVSIRTWIFGGFFFLFLLIVLALMTISIQKIKQNTVYKEISSRIQIHGQRLAISSQQTMSGKEAAFTQLRQSREKLNHSIALLAQGGIFRSTRVSPISDATSASYLDNYRNYWLAEEKKVAQILKSKNTLIKLENAVKKVNAANNQFLKGYVVVNC